MKTVKQKVTKRRMEVLDWLKCRRATSANRADFVLGCDYILAKQMAKEGQICSVRLFENAHLSWIPAVYKILKPISIEPSLKFYIPRRATKKSEKSA